VNISKDVWIAMEISGFARRLLKRNEIYLLFVIIALAIMLSLFNPNFMTLENLFDILRSYSFMGILAVGVLTVLLSGGIDISFTANATVAQYVMAYLLVNNPEMNIFLAVLIPCSIGIALGFINASLIYYLNAPPIIITISTLNVYFGVLQFISGGKWLYNFPVWFRNFSKLTVIKLVNPEGIPYGLSILTIIWIVIILITFFILKYTTLGRKIYAMGGNIEAAKRSGLNILQLQMFVYCFMGLLAGIASIIQALLAQTVAPNAIMGRELEVIAAVVLGGASLAGGRGSLIGTLLGVSLIAVVSNGLTLMRVSSYWQKVFIGLIIIISVSITALQRKAVARRVAAVDVEE
jgi:simple sugar transport system permease protein